MIKAAPITFISVDVYCVACQKISFYSEGVKAKAEAVTAVAKSTTAAAAKKGSK